MLGVLCARRLRTLLVGQHMVAHMSLRQHGGAASIFTSLAFSTQAKCVPNSPQQTASHISSIHTPVAIVGAGPTGLTMSILLSKLGIPHILLEQKQELTRHPQAHYINYRTMEIFRTMGTGLYDAVLQQSPPLDEWRRFVYCESLAGKQYGVVDHFPGQATPTQPDTTPAHVAHLSQHRLVPLLYDHATAVAQWMPTPAVHPLVCFGKQVTGVTLTNEGVTLQVVGSGGEMAETTTTVQAQYVVAADGANSCIRNLLHIPMEGPDALQHLINVHFFSQDMTRRMQQAPCVPGMLHFVFNTNVIAAIVTHNLQQGEFVAQVPFFPPLQSVEDFPPSRCAALLAAAAGVPASQLHVDVQSVRAWTMTAQVAARFSQGNRVFLVGDAAHRFPPSGGFGMNTGIQDAHNLAWKLAAVIQGAADARMLSSYEAERKPVAVANTALSVRNWQQATSVPAALGLSTTAASAVQQAATVAARVLPQALAKQMLDGVMAAGRNVAGVWGPLGPIRRAALDRIFTQGESLRLQFVKEDLGFVYDAFDKDTWLVQGSKRMPDAAASTSRAQFTPTATPGARLPHVPVRILQVQPRWALTAGAACSLLDMVLYEAWTAIVWGGTAMVHAVHAVATKQPLHVVHVVDSEDAERGQLTDVSVVMDGGNVWSALMDNTPTVVLVRPDGHIAWRGVDIHAAVCSLLGNTI